MAHRATLQSGGRTAVILGSGLLHWYPREHKRLFNDVVDHGGVIVSSFAVDTKPFPSHFPVRNRIIAGLSKACVVVQAARKSGAAITARYALEEGREVFAVPGMVDDELSIGCHMLIQEGATVLYDIGVLLSLYGTVHSVQESAYGRSVSLDSDDQTNIMRLCVTPQSTDDLVECTKLAVTQVQDVLFELQLLGKIEQNFAGMWVAR